MAKPNSWLTMVRFAIVRWIEPQPDKGEAWCINCSLNEYLTFIVNADGIKAHAQEHVDSDTNGTVRIMAAWPGTKRETE